MAAKSTIDIQDIVEDWAWFKFRTKADKKQLKLLGKELINLDIDWKRVKFVHDKPEYVPEPPKPGTGKPLNNTLFETTFTNKTNDPQTYSFKTERSTKTACTVCVSQGYTQGVNCEIKLATPCSILEANVGYSREITMDSSQETTVEESQTWAVDSQIEVKGRHKAEAQLVIVEEEYKGSFTIKSHIKGRVRAVFLNIKDNNSFIKAIEDNIDNIVSEAMKKQLIKGDVMSVDGATRSVLAKTTGSCVFKYGIRQDVEVDQHSID